MKTSEEINQYLDEKIPRSAVEQREGGRGVMLDYLAGHYVIDRLNKIFGNTGWSKYVQIIDKEKEITKDRSDKDQYNYVVVVKVALVIGNITKEDIGCCAGVSKKSYGDALEMAYKGAVTDTLKRCAKDLGMSMGLALYDKSQDNVSDEAPKAPLQQIVLVENINDKEFAIKFLRKAITRCSTTDGTRVDPKSIIAVQQKEFSFSDKLETLDFSKLKQICIHLAVSYIVAPVYMNELT